MAHSARFSGSHLPLSRLATLLRVVVLHAGEARGIMFSSMQGPLLSHTSCRATLKLVLLAEADQEGRGLVMASQSVVSL
jgi:hypothetical protein